MSELVIRPARLGDLDGVYCCENASFEAPWSFAMLYDDICETPAAIYLVGLIDDQVVGYAGAHIVIDESHVMKLCVHPEYRQHGYGRALMVALMELSHAQGAEAVTLEVHVSNRPALRLYMDLGFTIAGIRRNYYAGREDAYVMWYGEGPQP